MFGIGKGYRAYRPEGDQQILILRARPATTWSFVAGQASTRLHRRGRTYPAAPTLADVLSATGWLHRPGDADAAERRSRATRQHRPASADLAARPAAATGPNPPTGADPAVLTHLTDAAVLT